MRRILVQADKKFILTVPDEATLTFGPWSPPSKDKEANYSRHSDDKRGTLRVYNGAATAANIMGVFSGVISFRDMSLGYAEEVAKEEGAVIWKDDEKGYYKESKVSSQREWVVPALPVSEEGVTGDNF